MYYYDDPEDWAPEDDSEDLDEWCDTHECFIDDCHPMHEDD